MLPLYATRIEDLGPGDFVKVDCAACHHVALLTSEALLRVGLSPAAKVLDLKGRLRCRAPRLGGSARQFQAPRESTRFSHREGRKKSVRKAILLGDRGSESVPLRRRVSEFRQL
jgi:hypothetical protein